jgi:hypothetical protein
VCVGVRTALWPGDRAWCVWRVPLGLGLRIFALFVLIQTLFLLALSLASRPAAAEPVKGEASAIVENGFARLSFKLAAEVEAQVRVSNSIIIITFKRPVDINVDKLGAGAADYIAAARRDPDGTAIRIALARKVTVKSMTAAERLFVDLLPDRWVGLPPGLPREVIEELARRAREAEKKVKQQRALATQNKMPAIRVWVSQQPTFTRYTFDLPDVIGVASSNDTDKLTLTFNALLKFDLADAKAALPSAVGSIESELDHDTVVVRFAFTGKVDVRTFREDLSYVVDVTPVDTKNSRQDATARSDELAALAGDGARLDRGRRYHRCGEGDARIRSGGVPRALEPTLAVLNGRLAEGLGRVDDALQSFQAAGDSWDRRAAAQGRLHEIVLKRSIGSLSQADAIGELETLTTVWRGDETELQALALLARLYTEEGRYRDAFHIMRTALAAHPNSEITRRIHDEAAETFDGLFLGGKADALPAIDALSLFYDYRDLTPIDRRGDEMTRRLADRLVAVDLLDQAAELLQHQVDHRLQGAARAQVATRLAVIYLMNRKPDRTLATLRATRVAELTNELRNQRLLLEARALSDLGRYGVALEIAGEIEGRAAVRLRADILWAARRWREAAEQIELLYGERWRDFQPLAAPERIDILRAAIGYALGEDTIGLARFREKYAGKMGEGAEARAFEVVTAPIGTSGAEFRDVAGAIAGVDTLDAFLRDMRTRYPESRPLSADQSPAPPQSGKPKPATTGAAAY